jgi:hypothetical protein
LLANRGSLEKSEVRTNPNPNPNHRPTDART